VSFHRYVALGDSTTEGLDDPYPDGLTYRGWADRLAELLAADNSDFRYANLAIRGRKIGLASVIGGLNDILRKNVDLEAVCGDIEAIVATLGGQGATVLVMTYPDPTAMISVAASRIRARVDAFNQRLRETADRHGAVMIDLEADGISHPSLWSPDRLHGSALGHQRITDVAAAALAITGPAPDLAATLTDPVPRALPLRVASDAAWAGRHLGPWVLRRLRGRSSGDGLAPKRPELSPVEVTR
jgi:lysophospholipase L1-like esterase